MSPVPFERLKQIVGEAARLGRSERRDFLDQECGDDTALRTEAESLLAEGERADDFLAHPEHAQHLLAGDAPQREAYLDATIGQDAGLRGMVAAMLADRASSGDASPPATAAAPLAGPGEAPGQRIDRYRLLQKIGEGGFGTVWMAEQREPVKRRVALKIIKLGMDTRQVTARFEAERQALAMMDHPNIAKVLDAGATGTGRPFFVMELVKGISVTEYCDDEELDTHERLRLFVQVCHAIQHAHQKGVIHRDIKPNNVLVTLHDGVPVPKVIDFGIAKAMNQELTEKTLFTEFRQLIGTPAYMSPEQAEMSGLDIDTRADVYALGVLLYELLTGTTPFDVLSLMESGYEAMLAVIREQEPERPSTRASTANRARTRSGRLQSGIDGLHLSSELRGDLDWIILKCLEKDRNRRYESAAALSDDVLRHLADEPVSATPPSTRYRVQKFVRRNRAAVIGGTVIVAVLVAGLIGTTTAMLWAFDEQQRAEVAEDATARELVRATAAEEATARELIRATTAEGEARRELARATEIKRLLTDMLAGVDPALARTADTTLLRRILDDTGARLDDGEITDELVAAELHFVTGVAYASLGLYSEAEGHLAVARDTRRRLLGDDHSDTLAAAHELARVYGNQRRTELAAALFRDTAEGRERVLGAEDPRTLESLAGLSRANLVLGRFDELRERSPADLIADCRRVYGEERQQTLDAISLLANAFAQQGRYPEALELYAGVFEMSRSSLGVDHPFTLSIMQQLAMAEAVQGRFAEADALIAEVLEVGPTVLGASDPLQVMTVFLLGGIRMQGARYAEARAALVDACERIGRLTAADSEMPLVMRGALGQICLELEEFARVHELLAPLLPRMRQVFGDHHVVTLQTMSLLTRADERLGRIEEARALRRQWQPLQLAAAETERPMLRHAALSLLAPETPELHDPERAREFASRACALAEENGDINLWRFLLLLARCQQQCGDAAAARAAAERALSLVPEGADEIVYARLRQLIADIGEPAL